MPAKQAKKVRRSTASKPKQGKAEGPSWPAHKVERRRVDKLVPYARNARTHTTAQVAQIAASIKEWGWTNPILIDEEGGVIAGHGRLLAAHKLGITEVPCMVARGWTKAQKQAYVIADNQLALNAGWDNDLLKLELGALVDLDFDLDLIGFKDDDLGELLGKKVAEDEPPPVPGKATSKTGQLWALGEHRVLCGDSTAAKDVGQLMGSSVAAVLVTSPPYWAKQEYDDQPGLDDIQSFMYGVADAWWQSIQRRLWIQTGHTSDQRAGVGPTCRKILLEAMWQVAWERVGWMLRSRRCWAKEHFGGSRAGPETDYVDEGWEVLLTFWRPDNPTTGQERIADQWPMAGVWKDIGGYRPEGEGGLDHPCPFPVALAARMIALYSKRGDSMADPFLGSGTTLIAAEQLGRTCYGMEIEPRYVDVTIKRWENFTGRKAKLVS